MTDDKNHSPTEEPFDLTLLVESFNLEHSGPESGGVTYEWEFPTTEINFTVDTDFAVRELFQEPHERKHVMRMTQTGRYWFDRKYEADVIMTGIQISPDMSNLTATYQGMKIIDHTNKSYLARFLRWILRR